MKPIRPGALAPFCLLCTIWTLCIGASGCSIDGMVRSAARTGVGGAVKGVDDSQVELRQALRDVLLKDDTIKQIAERFAEGAVAHFTEADQKQRVAALVKDMTDALTQHGNEMIRQFVQTGGDELQRTLQGVAIDTLKRVDGTAKELLHKDLVDTIELIIKRNAEELARILAEQLAGALGRSMQQASGQIARGMIQQAAQGLRDPESQAAIREFLHDATKDAVAGASAGLREELRRSSTQSALLAGVIGLGLLIVVLGLALGFFVRQYLQSSKALAVVAQKINEAGEQHRPLKDAIHLGAQRNRVDQWLSSFLKRRGL